MLPVTISWWQWPLPWTLPVTNPTIDHHFSTAKQLVAQRTHQRHRTWYRANQSICSVSQKCGMPQDRWLTAMSDGVYWGSISLPWPPTLKGERDRGERREDTKGEATRRCCQCHRREGRRERDREREGYAHAQWGVDAAGEREWQTQSSA